MSLDIPKEAIFERSGYGTYFIQSTIFGLATFFACAGLFVDFLINQPLETWGIVLFLSAFYFLFGFVVNYLPRFIRYLAFAFSAYALMFLYMKIGDRADFQASQFMLIFIFIASIGAVFWFFSRPQIKEFNQKVSSVDSKLKTSFYSKLKRRMNRRNGSRAHLTTNLKLKGK
jgi:signal transduction histidine kinase